MNPALISIPVAALAAIVGGVWKLANVIRDSKDEILEKLNLLNASVSKEVAELDKRVTVLEYSKPRRVNGRASAEYER